MNTIANCLNPFYLECPHPNPNHNDSCLRTTASILPGIGIIMYPSNICQLLPIDSNDIDEFNVSQYTFSKVDRYLKNGVMSVVLTLIIGVALLALGLISAGSGIVIAAIVGVGIMVAGHCYMQKIEQQMNQLPSEDAQQTAIVEYYANADSLTLLIDNPSS